MLLGETISTGTILSFVVVLLISIVVPIGCYLYFRRQHQIRLMPIIIGVVAFSLFVLVLERFFEVEALIDAEGNIPLLQQPVLHMLFIGFSAGAFHETARYVGFLLLKKQYSGVGTALAYGIGHGGIAAFLMAGAPMITNLRYAYLFNTGGMAAVLQTVSEAQHGPVTEYIRSMLDNSASTLLWAGIDCAMLVVIHIALSVVVWHAVNGNGKKRRVLYPVAIFLQAISRFPAALAQTGVLTSTVLAEALTLVMVAISVFAAWKIHKNAEEQPSSLLSL